MKRGEPLKRTTPLKRGKGLARSVLRSGGRLNLVSPKRKALAADRHAAVGAVFARDGWRKVQGVWVGGRCIPAQVGAPGRCYGPLTPHRLKKGSAGGGYTVENVVAACARMNDWIEDHPDEAHAMGLVVRQGETVEEAWRRMQAHGLLYGPSG